MAINPSWGTKRNCPSCNAHFYDLNKVPAVCPTCKHQFDPALLVRGKRKASKRTAPEDKKVDITPTILVGKKTAKKKDKKQMEDEDGGINEIAELEDVDDIENLQDLSELEEIDEPVSSGDDADDESIIEEMGAGNKNLVGDVEEEEAKALVEEIEDERESAAKKKPLSKPARKAR